MRRNRNSHWHRASKPSNNPPQASISGPSVPHSQIPPDPSPPLSSLITEMRIDGPRAMPPTHYIQNNSTSVRTHQEPADIGTSVPVGSASRSSSDLKKTIVTSTKLLLQAAATALKFTPSKILTRSPTRFLLVSVSMKSANRLDDLGCDRLTPDIVLVCSLMICVNPPGTQRCATGKYPIIRILTHGVKLDPSGSYILTTRRQWSPFLSIILSPSGPT
ncbi:uncharacterized protein EI90DRAFT_378593 [Cantharellus anzutake]|uniref:uncharacterized protein n=1 Tax=Cantharellus anzutake TaxID=1750568 RepID=UPI0019076F68|nr:uncharacterized protein EI90DRAFT_423742 [Cantharellus anzutake]XP_038918365.1 uncharacterized protein EI90DRAFT_378593 [Cantharellus anzutake]KAF8314639.1 hypothetical protein EI90DRAFT_423742 [Cantharellus anzutake]KAF8334937.1 hypothetical protein EI90DRAFT_378593 [Cantharellus anzutake]